MSLIKSLVFSLFCFLVFLPLAKADYYNEKLINENLIRQGLVSQKFIKQEPFLKNPQQFIESGGDFFNIREENEREIENSKIMFLKGFGLNKAQDYVQDYVYRLKEFLSKSCSTNYKGKGLNGLKFSRNPSAYYSEMGIMYPTMGKMERQKIEDCLESQNQARIYKAFTNGGGGGPKGFKRISNIQDYYETDMKALQKMNCVIFPESLLEAYLKEKAYLLGINEGLYKQAFTNGGGGGAKNFKRIRKPSKLLQRTKKLFKCRGLSSCLYRFLTSFF